MANPREVLKELILKKSYREGDFTLSSGLKSKFYLDLKPTILHPVGAAAIGEICARWIQSNGLKFNGVGGLTLGADPLVMAVTLQAQALGLTIPATMIRKEPKGHGTIRQIEGVENFALGDSFLVMEDVVTTGGSAMKAVQILRDAGFKPTHVFGVVDRESGGGEVFKHAGLEFYSIFKVSDFF